PVPPAEPLADRAVAFLGPEPVTGALVGRRVGEAGRVGVTTERMADENDVVALGRELAVRLVGDADRVEISSAVEPHPAREVEIPRGHGADGATRGRLDWRHASDANRGAGFIVHQTDRQDSTTREAREMTTTESPVADNGVNVQALLDARDVLKGAPEAAQFTRQASSKWQHGVHSTTRLQNYFGLGEEQSHKTETVLDADHPEVFAATD